jgi:hypothetical protein
VARMPGVPFVVPRSFSYGRPLGPPRFIVIHYTAGSEGPTAAEDGVAYDQRRTDGTSAHFYTDRDSIIQCVDTENRSHTALYHGNAWGFHIEQCGTIQTRAQWLDAASRPTITNTAKVCAWIMSEYPSVRLIKLGNSEIRTGYGIGGHKDVTYGFPEDGGTHTDPGPAYPYDILFQDIQAIQAGMELDDMDGATLITGASDVSIGGAPASQLTKPLNWWLSAPYSHVYNVKVDIGNIAKALQALSDREEASDESERLAAAARFDETMAALSAIPGSDPAAQAAAIAGHLTPEVQMAMKNLLNGTRLVTADPVS